MGDKKRKYIFWGFLALVLIGALLAVSRSGYSDGDDAFFYRYANSMGFFEYLSWPRRWSILYFRWIFVSGARQTQ